MPNDELRRQVRREIRESNILVNETQTDIEHFTPYQLYERTPLDKVATACYYGENHGNIPIVLGDLPETVFRSTITNPLTLA
jgi:hypothetical protein